MLICIFVGTWYTSLKILTFKLVRGDVQQDITDVCNVSQEKLPTCKYFQVAEKQLVENKKNVK